MKQATGTHVVIPVNIYGRHSDVVSFLDSNREKFAQTENFLTSEQVHLESVRKYRTDLKLKVEEIKHTLNL